MSGRQHRIETVADLVSLWRTLPDDRREVMLAEVCQAVRLGGASADFAESLGAPSSCRGLTWIDDDAANVDISYQTPDGEEAFRLHVEPASEGEQLRAELARGVE